MKICLIDDKLMENDELLYKAALELTHRYPGNFEYHKDFFPSCFDDGKSLKPEIISVLDEYNVIIFHESSFKGKGIAFRKIIGENGKSNELIAFSGSTPNTKDFHPAFNLIRLSRYALYKNLESFVKDSLDKNIINLDLILNN